LFANQKAAHTKYRSLDLKSNTVQYPGDCFYDEGLIFMNMSYVTKRVAPLSRWSLN